MNFKQFFRQFVILFCITWIVSLVVSYLYDLIVHGSGALVWGNAFKNALILGIVISGANSLKKK